MKNPICFALDFPDYDDAARFIDSHHLREHLGTVKVGLELFIASGREAVIYFNAIQKLDVVLDLKLHDIPETVERAVKVAGDLGVKYMTMHIQQKDTMERAVKAAEPFGITMLGVTVLTSMTAGDCADLMLVSHREDLTGCFPGERALNLARFGYEHGLKGFVCSPKDVGELKVACPDAFFLVPGVRPVGVAVGDQKRVGTPAQAIKDGASLLVIGRPIRDAVDPAKVVNDILREISCA